MKALITEVGNASPGDEAITIAAAKRLAGFGCEVTVAYRTTLIDSFERAGLQAQHVHVPIAPVGPHYATAESLLASTRANQPQMFERVAAAVAAAEIVCVAPGGKYLDGYDNSLKLLTTALAREARIPYLVLHQSIGPLGNGNERSVARQVLAGASLVVARDAETYNFLRAMGLREPQLFHGGDPATAETYPECAGATYGLGVNLRWSPLGHSTPEGLKQFLRKYRDFDSTSRVLVYSTTTGLPHEVISVADEFGCEHRSQWCRYPAYLEEAGSCSINVTDSFHGVVFGLRSKVPTICLQADLCSWKLQGLKGPNGEKLRIFAGLSSSEAASLVAHEASQLTRSCEYRRTKLQEQAAILQAERMRCETAWSAVYGALQSVSVQGRHSPHTV